MKVIRGQNPQSSLCVKCIKVQKKSEGNVFNLNQKIRTINADVKPAETTKIDVTLRNKCKQTF